MTDVLLLQAVLPAGGSLAPALRFLAEPSVVMWLSVLVTTFSLGLGQGKTMPAVMSIFAAAVQNVAPIRLIIGGAGALKEVLVASSASVEIAAGLRGTRLPPLVLGWLIAGIIRVCLGSATVAGRTAASVMLPTLAQSHASNLMVLAIGAGSLLLSHFNDSGFWLFKEYFSLSIRDTLRSWSAMETIGSVVGLAGVLLLDFVVYWNAVEPEPFAPRHPRSQIFRTAKSHHSTPRRERSLPYLSLTYNRLKSISGPQNLLPQHQRYRPVHAHHDHGNHPYPGPKESHGAGRRLSEPVGVGPAAHLVAVALDERLPRGRRHHPRFGGHAARGHWRVSEL